MKLPELLLPAGDLQKAYYAFRYGADAIYCGVPMFALRTRANVFTEKDISEIVDFAHKSGKKVYITLNGFPHQNLIPALRKHLEFLSTVNPDGIILADAGVLELANEICPSVAKHLSVQASTVSESGIRFWAKNGVKRIILAREIAIKEVAKIHEMFPEMELEYFVHGAVCMAYSGRCLLSNFMAQRDANRGMCAHSCRWNYRVFDEEGRVIDLSERESVSGDLEKLSNGKLKVESGKEDLLRKEGELSFLPPYVIDSIHGEPLSIRDFEKTQIWEEEERQGEFIPVEQDFHGTHVMSSRDMCMIEHLKEVVEAGVCSLKVEGRNKTIYYVSSVARAYRKALDDLATGKEFETKLWEEIHAIANRGFFAGFLHGKPRVEGQQYKYNRSSATHEFAGVVLRFFKKGEILNENLAGFSASHSFSENVIFIDLKNRINPGEPLTFLFPKISDDKEIEVKNFFKKGEKVEILHGGDGPGFIGVGEEIFEEGLLVRKKVLDKS